MRGLTCALACLLVVAAPAHAETFKGTANAGPAIAGDTIVWGQELTDGRAVLYARAPGRPRRALVRLPAPEGKGHTRGFGGVPGAVSASATRVAFTVSELVTRSTGPDTAASTGSVTPQLAPVGGPFTNPLGTCVGAYVSTAIEGETVAVAVNGVQPCGGVYVDGRKVSEDLYVRQVRLAGPYVAWEQWPGGAGESITVAEAATGTVIARFPAPRNRTWGEFDLDERGNVVTTLGQRLVTFSLAEPRSRLVARDIWSGSVATAGGRVAYITRDSNAGPDRLVLATLEGKILRRLARYGERRRPVGEIALTDRRVAWSVRRGTYEAPAAGPGDIFTVKL